MRLAISCKLVLDAADDWVWFCSGAVAYERIPWSAAEGRVQHHRRFVVTAFSLAEERNNFGCELHRRGFLQFRGLPYSLNWLSGSANGSFNVCHPPDEGDPSVALDLDLGTRPHAATIIFEGHAMLQQGNPRLFFAIPGLGGGLQQA